MPHPTKRRLLLRTFLVIIAGLILIIPPMSAQATPKKERVRRVKPLPITDYRQFLRTTFKMIAFEGKGYILEKRTTQSATLWLTDGTGTGTTPIKSMPCSLNGYTTEFLKVGKGRPKSVLQTREALIFKGNFFFRLGKFWWRSDGTSQGTVPVGWMMLDSQLYSAVTMNNILYLKGPNKLWRTDGTQQGTWLIKRLENQGGSSLMVKFKERLFFSNTSSHHGNELWVSDGTSSGTSLFADINPFSPDSSRPDDFIVFNNELFFTADDGLRGRELWATNGNSEGNRIVADITPGPDGTSFVEFAAANNIFIFNVGGSIGVDLWRTDGSARGTVRIGRNEFVIEGMMGVIGDYLIMSGYDDIWRTNGTASGTKYIKQNPGAFYPTDTVYFGDKIYFNGFWRSYYDGVGRSDYELWVTDGTQNGTKLVENILPGYYGYHYPKKSDPHDFIRIGDSILFIANYRMYDSYNYRYQSALFKLTLQEPLVIAPILDLLLLDDEH